MFPDNVILRAITPNCANIVLQTFPLDYPYSVLYEFYNNMKSPGEKKEGRGVWSPIFSKKKKMVFFTTSENLGAITLLMASIF